MSLPHRSVVTWNEMSFPFYNAESVNILNDNKVRFTANLIIKLRIVINVSENMLVAEQT